MRQQIDSFLSTMLCTDFPALSASINRSIEEQKVTGKDFRSMHPFGNIIQLYFTLYFNIITLNTCSNVLEDTAIG